MRCSAALLCSWGKCSGSREHGRSQIGARMPSITRTSRAGSSPRKPANRKLTPVQQRRLRTLQLAWDALYDVKREFRPFGPGNNDALRQACRAAQIAISEAEARVKGVRDGT